MSTENRLMIQLLGQPRILWGDQPLTIPRKLARVFMYYLACQKSMVGRSDLVVLFWPESSNSRQHLRDLLSKLRAELPDPEIIRTDRDWIGLDYNKVNSDVLIFEDLYEQLSLPFLNIENRPLPEAIYQKLLNAIHMWAAPAFMYGHAPLDREDLDEWIIDKNRKLRFKRLSLLMRAANHQKAKGDLESALSWLEMINENDDDYDFPQVIYHRLDVLYRLGRLSQAFEYGMLYIDEINTAWFAEYRLSFEALMKRIENERNQESLRLQPVVRSTHDNLVPFVGRDDLITEMKMAYQRGDIVVLYGETGSGKSRLLSEFLNRQSVPNPVYMFEAVYSERNIAFHPIIELLRKTLNMGDWQKIEKFWISQLSHLMPELQVLGEHRSDIFGLMENHQLGVCEAFRQVLATLSGKQKIIFCVENSQWLDEESVRLIAYLTHRQFFKEKAQLILLIENDEQALPIYHYLKDPARASQVAWIALDPLDMEDAAMIAQYLLRKPLSEGQKHIFMAATGGNPLFVIETLQMISEKVDLLKETNREQMPLSGVVQIVIRERLSHVSDLARQILGCAALIGTTFTYDYVRVMAELQEALLVAGIDELIDKGIIAISSQIHQPLEYKFCQTFVQAVVLQGLSQTHKHVLHKRLVSHLYTKIEEKKTADELADLSYHLSQAGKVEQAFQYSIEAAEIFKNMDADQKAHRAYEQAYLLSQDRNFILSEQQLYELWIGWGDLATKMSDFESATKSYQRAIEEGWMRNSSLLIGSGLSGEGYLFTMRGLPVQAMQYLERAAFHLKDGYLVEYIQNTNRKMKTQLQYFDLQSIFDEFESITWSESQLKTDKDQLVFASLENTIAMACVLGGEFKTAESIANKSILKALKFNNSHLRIENEFTLGLGFYYQGMYKQALEKFGLALQIAQSYDYWRLVLGVLAINSRVFLAIGKTYQCLENIQNGYTLAKVYQYTGLHGNLINTEGKLYVLFGDYQKAISLFEESIKFSHNKRNNAATKMWIAWCKFRLGEIDEGSSQLEQVVEELKNFPFELISIESKARLGLALYLKGDLARALTLLEEVTLQSQKFGFAAAGTAYAYIQAQEAIRTNDPETTTRMGEIILQKAKQEESPWLEWHALEILMAAEKMTGESCKKLQNQKQFVFRILNQSKPQNLGFTLEPDSPPLTVLM